MKALMLLSQIILDLEGDICDVVVPDYTPEQLIEIGKHGPRTPLCKHVKAVPKRNELIHGLRKGQSFFFRQNTDCLDGESKEG